MKRYNIEINQDFYNLLKQTGGASSGSSSGQGDPLDNLDFSNLGDIDFNSLLGIDNQTDDAGSDSLSTASATSSIELNVLEPVLAQPSAPIRAQSGHQMEASETIEAMPILRSKSVGDEPMINPVLIQAHGAHHDEIEDNLEITLEEILQDEDISVRVIPVTSDGSCGISSIISLLTGKAPSSIEAYFKRRELEVESLQPSEVFVTGCHGANISSSRLMEIVQEELDMNLAVINHNSIRIPAELIENAPFIFIVGDGNHYNAVEIDGNRILRMETQPYLYNQILQANELVTVGNEKILVAPE